MVKTIDLAPSWLEILPVLLLVYTEGEHVKARRQAFEELQRMAKLADAYVKVAKAYNKDKQELGLES